MAQADYIISNQTFPNTRADINNHLSAIATNNSGTSAPTTQYAGQFWIDTTTTTWTLYIHDGTDDIQFATIDTSANTVNFTDSALDVVTDTTPQLGGDLDLNSNDITGTGNINITGNITASGNLAGTLTTASQTNITSVGTLTSATVSGDLTVDTDTLYVDSSNNRVGVGTTSPSTALDVDGTVTATQFVGGGLNPYRNLIINGDMSIAQRGTSQANAGLSGGAYQVIDRFQLYNSSLGEFTVSQSTDVPTGQGFGYSTKWDCTTANASPSAGNYAIHSQSIEGQMLQHTKKGTANAESLTLSFWVKSNKTGTYITELFDTDNSRQISKSYTINSASTWEKKTITFEGDTSGVFDNDNGESLLVHFWLGVGSTYSSGTLSTTWTSPTNSNRVVGQVNLADNTANEWYITGVQLEVGTSASDFEFLPYDVNLQRCYRYLYNWISESNYQNICLGSAINTTNARGIFQLPIKMRTAPSVSANGNFRIVDIDTDVVKTGTGSMISIARSSSHIVYMNFATNGSLTKGDNCEMGANNDVDAEILFDAEL